MFRPLIGTDKMEILATARKIGTYETSSEPFHDCCPVFMPRTPALYASAEELDEAESKLDVRALVAQGVHETTVERFYYRGGKVERIRPSLALRRRIKSVPLLREARKTRLLSPHKFLCAHSMRANFLRSQDLEINELRKI